MIWKYNNNMYIRLMNYVKIDKRTKHIKWIRAAHHCLSHRYLLMKKQHC